VVRGTVSIQAPTTELVDADNEQVVNYAPESSY
jgi:hypothetical protein